MCVHSYRKSPRLLTFDVCNGTDSYTPKHFNLGLPVFLPEGLQAKAGSIVYLSYIFTV